MQGSKTSGFLRVLGTFALMNVHVGKVLRELYLSTGLKMEGFCKGVPFSDKTIYYHFGKADLNTSILEKYELGLKKLGFNVDIWEFIAQKRREQTGDEAVSESTTSEPLARYGADESVASLLRRAAHLLEEQEKEYAAKKGEG